ncbi:Putative peptidyl-prolyl cis-trans isomerase [Flavobacteriales bacterium]|nr:putative peptidyl-prolyl cis-trans isomerase [Flavobacteriales bacterium]MCL4817105.1 peptidylprolyl isomerase [Flavobacteriales bacterium]WKZ75319.1 MAG: peptidylprolyl isomerase [Vicingaceae bacterium]CAG0993181.1 Putative peptidyl-prolyl cis-trans isomerase [Flavobacteriales bacterium]
MNTRTICMLIAFFGWQTIIFAQKNTEMNPEQKMVLIETSLGNITVKLYNETPLHCDNFLKLVEDTFYNGCIFHRVINQFMIQGGDPDSKNPKPNQVLGNGGPGYTIAAEIVPTLFHKKGVLAAARLGDNVNPDKESSGSQFYIVQGKKFSSADLDMLETRMGTKFSTEQRDAYTNIGGTPHLDGNYTVFGEVVEGLEVVDKIAQVQTHPANNRPLQDIKMNMKIIQ